jgi:hypothetical protein
VGNSHSLLSLLKKMNANFKVLTPTAKLANAPLTDGGLGLVINSSAKFENYSRNIWIT